MDKASIVKDAINYIYNLQNQVDQIQSDISDLNSRKEDGGAQSYYQHSGQAHLDGKPCHQQAVVKQEHCVMEVGFIMAPLYNQ